MKRKKIACPCGSGDDYRTCCQRFHRGDEPGDPVTLLRSRFSAFALGEGTYLWRTVHPTNPVRAQPEAQAIRELGQAKHALRYRALIIHDQSLDGDRAQILFTARVFAAGRDRSFVELSRFERTDEGWRYVDGDLWPAADLEGAELSIAALSPP